MVISYTFYQNLKKYISWLLQFVATSELFIHSLSCLMESLNQ